MPSSPQLPKGRSGAAVQHFLVPRGGREAAGEESAGLRRSVGHSSSEASGEASTSPELLGTFLLFVVRERRVDHARPLTSYPSRFTTQSRASRSWVAQQGQELARLIGSEVVEGALPAARDLPFRIRDAQHEIIEAALFSSFNLGLATSTPVALRGRAHVYTGALAPGVGLYHPTRDLLCPPAQVAPPDRRVPGWTLD